MTSVKEANHPTQSFKYTSAGPDFEVLPAGTLAKLERMREALEPFAYATVTPSGEIIGIMREDIRKARAALEDTK